MIRFFKILVAMIWVMAWSFAWADDSRILDQRQLPNQLGTYLHSQIAPADAVAKIDIYTVKLSQSYHARFYLQPVSSQSQAKFMGDLDSAGNFILAINGGFYTRKAVEKIFKE